jgi:ferredoxin
MIMSWLLARWTLGWALVKHVLLRPFAPGRSDPRTWLARIRQESLGPTPAANWKYFEGGSRCINCGLCDAVAPEGTTPSRWIMGAARQPSDAKLALDIARQLRGMKASIEQVCPARVQVDDVVGIIEENVRALQVHVLDKR